MNKEFVPYELAIQLKQLGFDIPSVSGYSYPDSDNILTQAILFQQAFRWFRKEHKIHGEVMIIKGNLFTWECYEISDSGMVGVNRITAHESISSNEFKTYEEAELACLKKLIEIVKQFKKD
jgi:hypothetical protein